MDFFITRTSNVLDKLQNDINVWFLDNDENVLDEINEKFDSFISDIFQKNICFIWNVMYFVDYNNWKEKIQTLWILIPVCNSFEENKYYVKIWK